MAAGASDPTITSFAGRRRSGLSIPALAALTARGGPGVASAAVLNALQTDPASGNARWHTRGSRPSAKRRTSTSTSRRRKSSPSSGTACMRGSTPTTPPIRRFRNWWRLTPSSEDGMTHTMELRKGVMFHNGEEMKAADALASVERWGRISGVGKNLMAKVTSLTADRRLHARVETLPAIRHDPDRAGPQHPGLHDPPEIDPRCGRRRANDGHGPVHRHGTVQAGRVAT